MKIGLLFSPTSGHIEFVNNPRIKNVEHFVVFTNDLNLNNAAIFKAQILNKQPSPLNVPLV